PNHRSYYSKVERIERPDAGTIKFIFKPGGDRELPLLLGLMPILPKHIYAAREFEATTFDRPIGSGPYVVSDVRPGAAITYKHNPGHWSADLPANRGRFNFDKITYEYFRDSASRFEAFKKGVFDFQHEWSPAQWATGYDFPAVNDGRIVKEEIIRGTPAGMLGLVFNTRRPIFADRRVRQALTMMFDFEWINAKLYHGLYGRTQSFYHGSELAAFGRPASDKERALLAPFAKSVLPGVMAGTAKMPVSDGTGRNRASSRAALKLLKKAGYQVRAGALVNTATDAPFTFEIMVTNQRQERLSLAYAKVLERIGVSVKVRQIDSAQFQKRRQSFDFDMIENFWYASLSPGNEQKFYWGVNSAKTEGSRNYMGVADPAIDAMVDAMLAATDRKDFVVAVRALDRILMSGSYVIPLFNWPAQWVARWARLGHPSRQALDGYKLDTWWAVPQ
ncbi:MAG: extracellular solute-binding protein, partial [Alphaproteobacteria bacterium]